MSFETQANLTTGDNCLHFLSVCMCVAIEINFYVCRTLYVCGFVLCALVVPQSKTCLLATLLNGGWFATQFYCTPLK